MAPRKYQMDTRARAAQQTRERIVHATMELHQEQGVGATSHKDIARRADVSVGTVYHHFPTLDHVVRACGARTRELFPPPSAGRIDRHAPVAKRVRTLVQELVTAYERSPWMEKIRLEAPSIPALAEGLALRTQATAEMIRRALGPHRRRRNALAVIAAIVDVAVINRLFAAGMSRREIVNALTSLITAWLEGGQS